MLIALNFDNMNFKLSAKQLIMADYQCISSEDCHD